MTPVSDKPFDRRSIVLYVILQTAALIFCWGWFAVWWSVAFFSFRLDQFEWWLLFATSLAGLYGLRPNLERAIDHYWIGAKSTPTAVKERAEQLRPVKRRIDVIFSLTLSVLLVVTLVIWYAVLPRQ